MAIAPDDPRHGERRGYLAGCREECCVRGCRRDMKLRELRKLREGPLDVDPGPLRAVVKYWRDRGLSMGSVAAAAGVNKDTIRRAIGQQDTVHLDTLRKVTSFTEDDIPGTSFIYAALTRMRVASLMADGQQLREITATVGLPMAGNWRQYPRVTVQVARAVRDLYQHSPGYGPHKGTSSRALNNGSVRSQAWRDPGTLAEPVEWTPEICEPSELVTFDETAVIRRCLGDKKVHLSSDAEYVEVVRRLKYDQRMSLAGIERFAGLNSHRYKERAAKAHAALLVEGAARAAQKGKAA